MKKGGRIDFIFHKKILPLSKFRIKMNKIIYLLLVINLTNCSSSNKELYSVTDTFVESLHKTYDSYGVLGGDDHKKVTSDSQYQVMPVGRLINIKILKVVSDDDYLGLKDDLKNHYKNDKRVNDVYISNGGTIMIDCRN
jgi:hypothetical protein